LTTFSGSTPVTIGNLPGMAGPNTYGEFATGTFFATAPTETFNWNGADSAYTVVGAISVQDVSAVIHVSPGLSVFQGDNVTLSVVTPATPPIAYEWLTDNASSGASWSAISGATGSNYIFNASTLNAGTHEYEVVISNSAILATSAPVSINVSQASFPVLSQDISPASTNEYVGASITYTVAFDGNHPITNQWQFSSDNGATFVDLAGATNTALTLTDLQLTNSGDYRCVASNAFGGAASSVAALTVIPSPGENIAWGPAAGITGDVDLVTNGIYFDGFIPNTAHAVVAADGIVFNTPTTTSGLGGTDGIISFQVNSGTVNNYGFSDFPASPPSSVAFASVMDAAARSSSAAMGPARSRSPA
jgi:hypothetical protein